MFRRREIHFPETKRFSELFAVDPNAVPVEFRSDMAREGPMTVSTYMSVNGGDRYYSLKVKPAQKVIDFLRESLIFIEWDTIHFEAVVRDDGTALLIAKHNKILGSRWLALIPQSDIPKEEQA